MLNVQGYIFKILYLQFYGIICAVMIFLREHLVWEPKYKKNFFIKVLKYEMDQLKTKSTDFFGKQTNPDVKQTITVAKQTVTH